MSVGLTAGLVAGLIAFFISSADGPRGVPQDVVAWASVALAVCGLVALFFFPAHGNATSLRRVAVVLVLCAPLLILLSLLSLQHACPLYVGRRSGFCYYQDDVLGGWSAAAAVAIGFDVLIIAVLVGVSARQSRLASTPPQNQVRVITASNTVD